MDNLKLLVSRKMFVVTGFHPIRMSRTSVDLMQRASASGANTFDVCIDVDTIPTRMLTTEVASNNRSINQFSQNFKIVCV